jgi:hypothetical protein
MISFCSLIVSDDHTVINLNTLRDGRYLTMRTLTDNGGESQDTTAIDLDDVLKKVMLFPRCRSSISLLAFTCNFILAGYGYLLNTHSDYFQGNRRRLSNTE